MLQRLASSAPVRAARRLAPESTGWLEGAADYWRGRYKEQVPFNGQEARRGLVEEYFRRLPPSAVVETGTYLGATTLWLASHAAQVHTIEMHPRYYHGSRMRLRRYKNVAVYRGDSRTALRRFLHDPDFPRNNVFFYLDAHWYDDLPLADELNLIHDGWTNWVAMVDDFAVPGDEGYEFDDYGPGRRLSVEYLPGRVTETSEIFWPTAPSESETGAKRGTLIVAQGRPIEVLRSMEAVRPT
jgi:hypothetical protein